MSGPNLAETKHEYDFQGKAKALEHIMKAAGCTEDETVFVGDAFNDKNIMLMAGKAIAYPPKDNPVDAVSQVKIEKDDLNLVLPHVCLN
jgi:phosphoserine phosphatase